MMKVTVFVCMYVHVRVYVNMKENSLHLHIDDDYDDEKKSHNSSCIIINRKCHQPYVRTYVCRYRKK